MKYILSFLAAIVFFSCQKKETTEVSLTKENYQIIGYVAGWKELDITKIPAEKLTIINYAFANVEDGIVKSGEGDVQRDSLNFATLHQLKKINPDLKILVSIGGWAWSKGFSDAVLTAEGRKTLTKSGIDFLIRYQLDGLDFDWEYPAWPGDNNPVRSEDKENFVAMLKDVRAALDSLGDVNDVHYLTSIASGGFIEYLEVNDLRAAQQYLDFVNIMSYDFFTAGDDTTGHHSNLFVNGKKGRSAAEAVKDHIEFGVPAEKIIMGIPFYGRMWEKVHPQDNGLFQPGKFKQGLPYNAINKLLEDSTYVRYWDEIASAPYIYSERDSTWITFEDEESIARKMEFIKENGLGGAMFWELSEDPSGSLLENISQKLEH